MLFVGEKQSGLARRKGWHWSSGRLAAKQLFDALRECGIEPEQQQFCNWFATRQRHLITARHETEF